MDTQQRLVKADEQGVWAKVITGGPSLQLLSRIVEAAGTALRNASSYDLRLADGGGACPRAHPWEGEAGTCRAGPCGPDRGWAVVLGTDGDLPDDRARAGQVARELLADSARAGLIASIHAQPAVVPLARDHLRLMLGTSGFPQLVVFVRPLRTPVAASEAGSCPMWQELAAAAAV
ncbi:hypothetical protein ACFQY4_19270 [Catellatospora bangladeshensis]|uniref:Uncharacterized protein n=1 Tax=Catellatospora bangladeshensis TaxID=310355 RepID=A0A8J3JLC9_9ACTN|nr:hypothetical protein [Catellatospora bangladeshensis]GIF84614.1 hypothetical protein Cba03nite_59630 [Catellatospora bangladeshensis]